MRQEGFLQIMAPGILRISTTLKRSGKSRDEIEEMMGHSTSQVTEQYLASLDMDKTWEINKGLF